MCAEKGYSLLIGGEMGIGNTTTSAAVTAALTGAEAAAVTGRGAGLSTAGLERKIAVIEAALSLHKPDSNDSIDVLHKVGEMCIRDRYIGQDKTILLFDMPMTYDRQARNASHDAAADALCALLDEGKTVVFLTLGDPTVYSTYWYVHKRVAARGYAAELVPGVPSFCAAAAAMGRALCDDCLLYTSRCV